MRNLPARASRLIMVRLAESTAHGALGLAGADRVYELRGS